MNYVEIVNLVFSIIFGVYALMMLHFIVFGIIGVFAYKKYPKTDIKNKYGIIIPARNEELVVGNLIESIHKTDYPQDKLHIFVIAHNCTDKTAEVARALAKEGFAQVSVYEYNNPNECTMGYAFRHLFGRIEEDYGTQSYDGFFIFNADNIVEKNYFTKMNDAFEYYDHKYVVASFRNSKNFGSNVISGLYGMYFSLGCVCEFRGRNVCGCSTRIAGCGYVISSKIVENGWPYVTLTEDWEFSADQILSNNKIRYCDEAIFYDEQPTSFKVMWRQRVRWSRGHLLVLLSRVGDLIKALFSPHQKHKMSIWDILMNCLPFCLVLGFIGILQYILLAFSPLFGIDFMSVLLGDFEAHEWWYNILFNQGVAWGAIRSFVGSYIGMVLLAVIVFIVCRKRIFHVSFGMKVLISLVWPLFLMLQFPIDFVAMCSKGLGWKVIPHADATTIHSLDEKRKN